MVVIAEAIINKVEAKVVVNLEVMMIIADELLAKV